MATLKQRFVNHQLIGLDTAILIYPTALRAELGLSEHSSCMSMGLQVANYQQLTDWHRRVPPGFE